MDTNEIKNWRPDIVGWSDDIIEYYQKIAPNLQDGAKIVEIGIYGGRSALFMANELDRLKKSIEFYGVDIMECPKYLEDKIIFMHMKSVDAAKSFDDNSLDFVFIDGDHAYTSVLSDIKAWLPKVCNGGILSGHDYNEEEFYVGPLDYHVSPHPDVIKAVNECFSLEVIERPAHSVWQYIKK